jgi:hypothetical protein
LSDVSRTADISDFNKDHLDVAEKALSLFKDTSPLLSARLADFIWVKKFPKEIKYATEAINQYLLLIKHIRINNPKRLGADRSYIERMKQIWKMTGHNTSVKTKILKEIENCLFLEQPEPLTFTRLLYFQLIHGFLDQKDCIKRWITIGDKGEEASAKQKDYEKAREYTKVKQELYSLKKDNNNLKKEREKEVDLFIDEVRQRQAQNVDPIILQDLFTRAILACRSVSSRKEEAKKLENELVQLQLEIPLNYTPIETSINLTNILDNFLKEINSRDLEGSLKLIALYANPLKKQNLFKNAKENIKKFPIQTIFTPIITDEKGKVIHKQSNKYEEGQIRAFATREMTLSFQIKGIVINRGLREIYNLFDLNEFYFNSLISPNPFIPSQQINQFKEGLRLGLTANWIASLSILIPLLENSLRSLIHNLGHNMVVIDTEGVQREKDLNSFIYSETFKEVFGEDRQFQLQVLLTDKNGLNLRNKIAHGLLVDSSSNFSIYGAVTWAITLSIITDIQNWYFYALKKNEITN